MSSTRAPWIDALKGWGMLLIVVGHVWSLTDPSPIYQWIYAFHVPLFFFAAGLTFKASPDSTWLVMRRRAPALLVPYAVFGLLGYAFYASGFAAARVMGVHMAQFDYGLLRPLWGLLYGSVGDGLLVNSPLWFIPALLVCTALVHTINRHVAQLRWRYAWALLTFAAGAWIGPLLKLPWGIAPALSAVIFMQLGLDFKRWSPALSTPAWLGLAAVLGLVSVFAGSVNGSVNLASPTVNHPLWFLVFAVVGMGLSVALVKLPQGRPAWLCLIGRHSLTIMVLHMLVIKATKVIMGVLTGQSMAALESHLFWGLLVLVITSVLLGPMIWWLNRYTPWVLGRS